MGLFVPPAGAAEPGWRVTHRFAGRLNVVSVAATSPKDAWAVMTARSGGGGSALLRWNGKTWARQKLPSAYAQASLRKVEATSPTNVWLYGEGRNHRGLLARWDGRAWKTVSAPTIAGIPLGSLLVRGPKNVWCFFVDGRAAHYDGTRWRTRYSGVAAYDSAASGGTVWVVGSDIEGVRPRIAVWNNGAWKEVYKPDLRGLASGVTIAAAGRPRAVGYLRTSDDSWQSVLYSWDGKAWRVVRGPRGPLFDKVALDGSGGLWATSWAGGVYRHTGGTWRRAPIKGAGPGTSPLHLVDLTRIPGTRSSVWAVGGHQGSKFITDALVFKHGR
ncbi:MAG TPA: hypothetical protein VHJ17_20570 [Thermomonospora sp.]|nr:hypothetical protein [Thermomonospora sp.]